MMLGRYLCTGTTTSSWCRPSSRLSMRLSSAELLCWPLVQLSLARFRLARLWRSGVTGRPLSSSCTPRLYLPLVRVTQMQSQHACGLNIPQTGVITGHLAHQLKQTCLAPVELCGRCRNRFASFAAAQLPAASRAPLHPRTQCGLRR